MDDHQAEVARLWQATDDELYANIGSALSGKPAFPADPRRFIDLGKGWFNSKRASLESLVCKDQHLRRLARQDVPTHELVVVVCGILDLGSHLLGAAPVVTVAVLVVRLGLHHFCAGHWQRDAGSDQVEKNSVSEPHTAG